MKTVYMAQKPWRDHTLDGQLERAVGDTGRIAGPCRGDGGLNPLAGEDKVIDLAAWKAENLVELDGAEGFDMPGSGLGQYEGRELVRRRRRKYAAAQARAELAATLAVAGVLAALILRILVF